MFRKVNSSTFLYLCQSADWQCVIQAEDHESAATQAVENLMTSSGEGGNLSMVVTVTKLDNNILEISSNEDKEIRTYYSPMILANAGFHNEAKKLDEILKQEDFLNE